MKKLMFSEPDCRLCSAHSDQIFDRFCDGGKKPRRFRSKDPKRRPPDWCPKRNNPAIIRVYRLKDEQSANMHYVFRDVSTIGNGAERYIYPSTHHYMKMFSGRAVITASGFYDAAKNHEALDLIDFELEYGDVVEIDDGFTPYFFYFRTYQIFQPAYFTPPADETPEKNKRKKEKS